MANLKSLQRAASEAAGKGQQPKVAPVTVSTVPVAASTVKPSTRTGKIAMTFHLPEDFKRSLRLVQAHRGSGCTFEQLAAEAFNDLFSKYNAPTVNMEPS